MSDTFYITTTLPYVNSDPHVGFALEMVRADVVARYQRLLGKDVIFNTGTDEHGLKIYRKAHEQGKDTQAYVDEYSAKFKDLRRILDLSYTHFTRTTDPHHIKSAQEFWKICESNGDIYKKNYQIKYCVGCELEKTDSELIDGKCSVHPALQIELIDEENYFFRFSKYQQKLLDLYKSHPNFVIPKSRLNEISIFVSGGLNDFSVSRLKEKMPWGVPVPGDETQVMYVWFDALVNYISALGWPEDENNFKKFWPGIQFAGKDNLRPQSAMWQAMLMSANLPNSKQIIINGFITSDGQKMSKSVGNVINPLDVVNEYGTDALRYFLLREIPPFEDGDFTMEKFKEAYNANLANGLGNLVSRVMKMAIDYGIELRIMNNELGIRLPKEITDALDDYDYKKALDVIWQKISALDKKIQETEPFKLIKTEPERAKEILRELVRGVYEVGVYLAPFLPSTSKKICEAVEVHVKPENLFARK